MKKKERCAKRKRCFSEVGQRPVSDLSISTSPGVPNNSIEVWEEEEEEDGVNQKRKDIIVGNRFLERVCDWCDSEVRFGEEKMGGNCDLFFLVFQK